MGEYPSVCTIADHDGGADYTFSYRAYNFSVGNNKDPSLHLLISYYIDMSNAIYIAFKPHKKMLLLIESRILESNKIKEHTSGLALQ